jgi:hypothetical protein
MTPYSHVHKTWWTRVDSVTCPHGRSAMLEERSQHLDSVVSTVLFLASPAGLFKLRQTHDENSKAQRHNRPVDTSPATRPGQKCHLAGPGWWNRLNGTVG